MRLLCILSFLFALAACGSDAADTEAAVATPTETPADTADTPQAFEPLTIPTQAAEPAGSAGTFRFYYVRGEGDARDTTVFEGFLPAPMPAEATSRAALDAVPDYEVVVQPSSVTADIDLRRNGYVFVTVNEVGEPDANLRSARRTFREQVDGLFRGTAYAFTFPPLWEAAGTPRLAVRVHEDETDIRAEMDLPITAEPSWAQPVTLPTVPADTPLKYHLDLTLADADLVPVLIYPSTFGTVGWGASVLEVDTFAQRRRERAGATDLGVSYKVWAPHADEANPDAFLVLLRP